MEWLPGRASVVWLGQVMLLLSIEERLYTDLLAVMSVSEARFKNNILHLPSFLVKNKNAGISRLSNICGKGNWEHFRSKIPSSVNWCY